MTKSYVEINLKNIELARYSYDSERRNPSFEWAHIQNKKFKFNFIEIYGVGLELSPTLSEISLFKNKNKQKNPFILKNKKPMNLLTHKTGSIIDIWELVIWCSEDYKKVNKNHDNGNMEVYYFSEEAFPYYEKDKIHQEEYEQWFNTGMNYPYYFNSYSKVQFEIMMDKVNFESIKKCILDGRKPKKNVDLEGNLQISKSLNFNKIKVEFNPNNKTPSTIDYDVNTNKKFSNNKKIIYSYQFDIEKLSLK